MNKKIILTLIALVLLSGCQINQDQESDTEVKGKTTTVEEPELINEETVKEETVKEETIKVYTEHQFLPKDEISQDESLVEFVNELKVIIENRDLNSFKRMCNPYIKLSFGGDGGVDEIDGFWKLDTKEGKDKFWGELEIIIKMGGVFQSDNRFSYPYTFSAFPIEYDSWTSLAVIDQNVVFYEEPDEDSKVLGYLYYNIVEWADPVDEVLPPDFQIIKLYDGVIGYVKSETVRSPIDYRLGISKDSGEWKMDVFIAGD